MKYGFPCCFMLQTKDSQINSCLMDLPSTAASNSREFWNTFPTDCFVLHFLGNCDYNNCYILTTISLSTILSKVNAVRKAFEQRQPRHEFTTHHDTSEGQISDIIGVALPDSNSKQIMDGLKFLSPAFWVASPLYK